jgi:hypothetical protein
LAVLGAGLGGCDSAAQKRAAEQESLIPFLTFGDTPQSAVADMNDQFDAGKRLRGILLVSNAPFGGEDVYVRGYAKALGAIAGEPADPDVGVRAAAARALSMHGGPEHVPLIVPLLDPKGDRQARLAAARALQRLHNPAAAVLPLIAATVAEKEPDAEVRAEACTALGQYAEARVVQALIGGVDDDQLAVNVAARGALKTLTGQDFGDNKRAWVEWAGKTGNLFAAQSQYRYPAFKRSMDLIEYLPLVAPPPNEEPGIPRGMTPVG